MNLRLLNPGFSKATGILEYLFLPQLLLIKKAKDYIIV
jgi:hypothetical protein